MKLATIFALLIPLSAFGVDADEVKTGSVCLEAYYDQAPQTTAPGLFCDSRKLSLKIDDRDAIAWPSKENMRITGLDLAQKHRVVLYCGSKPQQAFKFRYSQFHSKNLCLFIDPVYRELHLVDADTKDFPRGCKCK